MMTRRNMLLGVGAGVVLPDGSNLRPFQIVVAILVLTAGTVLLRLEIVQQGGGS